MRFPIITNIKLFAPLLLLWALKNKQKQGTSFDNFSHHILVCDTGIKSKNAFNY